MARQRYHTYSTTVTTDVDVDIDINDVLEDLDDEFLLDEIKARGYEVVDPDDKLTKQDLDVLRAALDHVKVNTPRWWVNDLIAVKQKIDRLY